MGRLGPHRPAEGRQHRVVLPQVHEGALPAVHGHLHNDQLRVHATQTLRVEASIGVGRRRPAENQDVGVAHQRRQACASRAAAEVRYEAAFAPVEHVKGGRPSQPVADGRLDFDDIGPQVAQQHRRQWPPDPFAAVENTHAAKRALHGSLLTQVHRTRRSAGR